MHAPQQQACTVLLTNLCLQCSPGGCPWCTIVGLSCRQLAESMLLSYITCLGPCFAATQPNGCAWLPLLFVNQPRFADVQPSRDSPVRGCAALEMSQACSRLELGAPANVQVLGQLAAKQLSIVPAGKMEPCI